MRLFAVAACLLGLFASACTPDASAPAPTQEAQPASTAASALFPVPHKEAWGYIDRHGTLVIEPQFDRAWRFSDGRALVRQGNRYGYIDTTGTTVIAPQFADAWHFSEGLAPVQADSLWGFVNRQGDLVVDPQFELVPGVLEDRSSNGPYQRANIDGQYGFRNPSGDLVIEPRFEQAWHFSEGRARVKQNGQWGFIDQNGAVVIEPQFAQAWDFRNGLARVVLPDGRVGYVDRSGTLVWPRS